jgi:hypothetical protein
MAFWDASDDRCPVVIAASAAGQELSVSSAGVSTPGALISTVPPGTPPLQVSSSTPVLNLTSAPVAYTPAGVQALNLHLVSGTCTAATNCSISFQGAAAFSNASSYVCSANDASNANPVAVHAADGGHATLSGTAGDVINFLCVGNP